MRTTFLFCLLVFSAVALADRSFVPPYGPPLVVMGHDREPAHDGERRDKSGATGDDECHEQHHLAMDGDNDCDDVPVKGIPEPGPLPLMALGLMALMGLPLLRRR